MSIAFQGSIPMPLDLPRKLFDYEVVDFLGEGAGSRIYVVADPGTRQLLALKHVVRRTEKDCRYIEQVIAEFEISRRFNHRGLRRSLDLKLTRTLLRKIIEAGLVMELVDGLSLEVRQPPTMTQLVECFIQVAEALAAMHHMGLVHCDLKPNNIMITPDLQVRLIDFGQACKVNTVKERIQGTPDYIAPEQVKRDPVTPRTDVFNFGATLYWALTGRNIPTLYTLKKDELSFLSADQIPSPHSLNPAVPENLSALVMECIRSNPARRPGDMNELVRRLELIRHALARSSEVVS